MELGLKDKVVLLTGGSGGIGRPLARAFADEGAKVALTYLSRVENAKAVAAEIADAGGQALPVHLDMTDPASVRRAVAEVTEEWGGIDVLVVNASASGGPSPHAPAFDEIPAERWLPPLRAEVEGAFHTVQATLPVMKPRGGGRIVFMSAAIVQRGLKGAEGYAASKSALHGLSRTLGTELFEHGILSNVVAPGPVVTEGLLEKLPEEVRGRVAGLDSEGARAALNKAMPFLHFSTVEDVVNATLFLASSANGNITGNVLYVDGGH
ncbi:SDR family oxidoreductase [Streptomyces roseicoloratus]|uniref:SDR family oxidoreductase n=1 Tax=Streptomyces roseicoloratus TaxID=2508722 RepID=A0ABY9RRI1_9ACTN|nr:SDR family oxidoreductase [Streptomyces roseicoloratus]WMX44552.1 SDR family oxidoreductase [Streptomyces roseicoloratus]